MNKKHKIIAVVTIVLTFLVGYFIGDSSAVNRINKQLDVKVSNKQDNLKEKVNTEPNKVIKLGQQGKVGNLRIKVLESKEKTAISNESGKSNASGKFIVLKLELKNEGKEATDINPHDFKLKQNNSIYEIDDNSFEALGNLNSQETIFKENKNFIGAYDKFNSGISKNSYVVFDVPKECKIENLKLLVEGAKNTEFNLK